MKTTNYMPQRRARLATMAALLCIALICCSLSALIQTTHAATFTVTNTNDSGAGSLRAAIIAANATAGPAVDTITFNIPGGGVHTIAPLTPLPGIVTPTIIDGYSQPGAAPNTSAVGANAVLLVELNGTSAGVAANGLNFGSSASGSTIKGLVINRFKASGIILAGANNIVSGNFIGTNAAGTQDFGNNQFGVFINGAAANSNTIGGGQPGARNVISGNGLDGIASGVQPMAGLKVQGNYIGTDKTGMLPLGNSGSGIVYSGTNGQIGGSVSGLGNVISANVQIGISVPGTGTSVSGNYVGTNASASAALGNGQAGVRVTGDNNQVGGLTSAEHNVVSGNLREGINLQGNGNKVVGNHVGINGAGTAALGNLQTGIDVGGSNNQIGGTAPGERNVVSGNGNGSGQNEYYGILVSEADNKIINTYVGTNGAGTALIANAKGGIIIMGSNTQVGGPTSVERNVIAAGTADNGIVLLAPATGNRIWGNYIGTDKTGMAPLGNFYGIVIFSATHTQIGGDNPGEGNLIAFNAADGVVIQDAAAIGNSIRSNSIHSNGFMGINLGTDSVTPNDPNDTDSGPNGLQNFPVITSAKIEGGQTKVTGTLNSVAGIGYRMHFYGNTACDLSGHGEGQNLLGSLYVEANTNDTPFTIMLPAVAPGTFITSTASAGGTSEFSLCVQALTPQAPQISVSDATVTEGDSGTTDAVFNVTLSAPSNGPVSFEYDTKDLLAQHPALAGEDYNPISGLVTFATGETSKQITVKVNGDPTHEFDEVFLLDLIKPVGATFADDEALGTIINDDDAIAQNSFEFEQNTYTTQENSTKVTVTIKRTGDLSSIGTVDYETIDGNATERGEYTTALGTLRFGPGENTKSFELLITEDAFDELTEESLIIELSNPSAGASIGQQGIATVKVMDDAPEQSLNANDDPETFVRQHYHDFLNREADQAGLSFWTSELTSCGPDPVCLNHKREQVSAAFFLSIEFQQTGFLVHRLTEASFDKLPRYRDFVRDSGEIAKGIIVGQGAWEQNLEANKQAFVSSWVNRSEFKAKYDPLTNEQYVAALFANTGVVPEASELKAYVNGLNNGTVTRAGVLRKVCESELVMQNETNRAFVLMQYFGYLRRNPDDAPDGNMDGYNFWLQKLNQFGGDYQTAEMVKAFLVSIEYRSRFGQP